MSVLKNVRLGFFRFQRILFFFAKKIALFSINSVSVAKFHEHIQFHDEKIPKKVVFTTL